ncbi:hypothetical protein K440DRAFT_631703 [Wilcoxina mikolae CBS 423.85]|nr:hypothetical protein K440DRAFT_631703 [Wilcoxina mikolae CBS 423.85]
MRSTRSQLEGTQLDFILLNNLRRGQVVSSDPLQNIRRCHRQGLEFDYQSEWQTWIDLESKKRVALLFFYWDTQQATLFGREMCQTVFDVRLQLPCEEFLWNASTPVEWFGKLDGVQEGLGLLEALKIFLDCRREPPALSPLSLVLVLHGLIAVGLDLQRRSPSIGHTSDDPAAKQSRISRAFEIWRGQLESLVPQVLLQSWYQKVLLMYHMAHIALHTNRQNLLVGAGDRRFYRRNSNDFYRAKQELQQWASIPSAQLAAWHAVQILLRYLGSSQMYHQDLYVSWSTYVATLICYTYGNMSTSPSEVVEQEDAVVWDLEQDMRAYLQMMNTDTWESLSHVRRYQRKRTDGLLAVVRNTMKLARWGLVQEGLEVLKRLGGATIKSV